MVSTNFSLPAFSSANASHVVSGQAQSANGYSPNLKHALAADTVSLTRIQSTPGIKFSGHKEDIKAHFEGLPEGTEKTVSEIITALGVSDPRGRRIGEACKKLVEEGFLIKNPDKSYKRNTASSSNETQS